MDVVIKVAAEIRDRLAVLAQERGVSMRDLVTELARSTLTRDELRERATRAEAYLRSCVTPDLSDDDLVAVESVWAAIEAGDIPEALPDPRRRAA